MNETEEKLSEKQMETLKQIIAMPSFREILHQAQQTRQKSNRSFDFAFGYISLSNPEIVKKSTTSDDRGIMVTTDSVYVDAENAEAWVEGDRFKMGTIHDYEKVGDGFSCECYNVEVYTQEFYVRVILFEYLRVLIDTPYIKEVTIKKVV